MLPGTIVEFTHTNGIKYYVKIKSWYGDNRVHVGGGIDAAKWFIKNTTKKGWYSSECGCFPIQDCREIKVCTNRSRLAMFLDV